MHTRTIAVLLLILCSQYCCYGSPLTEACASRFCPIGTFCDLHEVACFKPPCKPLTVCLPENLNGCKAYKCRRDQKCVETRTSCISRSCKKYAKCVPLKIH